MHLRPSTAGEGGGCHAGPKAVARSVHKKILARARREQGRRMRVSGPNFKRVNGPGRKKGKLAAFDSLQECEDVLFPL